MAYLGDFHATPATGINLSFTPAPGSPCRVVPDDPAPCPITLIEARSKPQCKVWRKRHDGTWCKAASSNESLFRRHVKQVPHGDVEALNTFLEATARNPKLCVVHGQPIDDGRLGDYVRRLKHAKGNQAATLAETTTRILWMDIDKFSLTGADVVESPELAVAACWDWLGLGDVSYGWYFSGGQQPTGDEVKVRLAVFLDREYTCEELKRWAKATGKCDDSLYDAAHLIYTADPLFLDSTGGPLPDWLPVRRGFILGGSDAVALDIPAPIVRDVVPPPADGIARRDPFVLRPLVAAIERATRNGDPRHPVIFNAARVAGGYVAGGAITELEALTALMRPALDSGSGGADRAVVDGIHSGLTVPLYAPNPIDDLPEAYKPADYPTMPADAVTGEIQRLIADVRANPKDADGRYRRVVIRAPAGLGKTEAAIQALRGTAKVLWLAPTNALASETEKRFNAVTVPTVGMGNLNFSADSARAMLGRGAPDPDRDEQILCRKPDALKAIKDQGLARHTKALLCKSGGETCEFLRNGKCGYFAQMKDTSPTRILAHNFLSLPTAELLGDYPLEAELAIIDESPVDSLIQRAVWTDDEKLKTRSGTIGVWLEDADTATVAGEILHGRAIEDRGATLVSIREKIAALEAMELPSVSPLMSDMESTLTLMQWTRPESRVAMLSACERYLRGDTLSLWQGQSDGKPVIRTITTKATTTIDILPTIILDATADEVKYRALFPNCEFHGFDVPMADGVRVVQITDSTLYRRKIDPSDSGSDPKTTTAMIRRLAAWLALQGPQGTAGIVSHKGTVNAVTGLVDALSLHFGALRGQDGMKHLKALMVAGRPEAGVYAAEEMARALWPRENLHLGETDYIQARGEYTMRAGRKVACPVRTHPDPRVAACVASIREEGLIQAIGRGRYIHSQGERLLLVATSVPIPGLIVDELVTLDEALPEARLSAAILAGKGTVPLSPKWLVQACPEVWKTEANAKDWLMDLKGGKSGYISITRKTTFQNPISYRLAGEGGKPKIALSQHTDLAKVAESLEALWGKPVVAISLKADDELPPASIPESPYIPPVPDPEPTFVESLPMGNLIPLFGPSGFDATLWPLLADDDDEATYCAPILAALIADGWHPTNAAAKARGQWLWRYGPPTVTGLLMRRAVAA